MATTAPAEVTRPLRRVEYDQLVSLGAFQNERIELLEGVLVALSPIGAPHSATVQRLNRLLVLALNGRAAVPEYWVVNLPERCIEVHTGPSQGSYARCERYQRGASVRLHAFLDVSFAVDDIVQ